MATEFINTICDGRTPVRCKYCHRWSTKRCDASVSADKICDAPLCDVHAWGAEKGIDFCLPHWPKYRRCRYVTLTYPARCTNCLERQSTGSDAWYVISRHLIWCLDCAILIEVADML
jgi:hypothetical protein